MSLRERVTLAAVFLSLASCSGYTQDEQAAVAECTATVSLQDFKLVPSELEMPQGHFELCARNDGKTPHDLGVRDASSAEVDVTAVLMPGESARLSLDLTPGSFTLFCSVAGHESLGMRGTLTVEP